MPNHIHSTNPLPDHELKFSSDPRNSLPTNSPLHLLIQICTAATSKVITDLTQDPMQTTMPFIPLLNYSHRCELSCPLPDLSRATSYHSVYYIQYYYIQLCLQLDVNYCHFHSVSSKRITLTRWTRTSKQTSKHREIVSGPGPGHLRAQTDLAIREAPVNYCHTFRKQLHRCHH